MSERTADGRQSWLGLHAEPPAGESLRERKKRLTRQQLSDTATQMFLERGFDAVRVLEVAEACGVSEKTVFNYFPTKESLLLDRWDETMQAVRDGLTDPAVSPVEATTRVLNAEMDGLTGWFDAQSDPVQTAQQAARFVALIDSTPSLRAHQHDMMDRLHELIAEILARRAGMPPADPEPQIAAAALLGLWHVQFRSLRTTMDGSRSPAEVRAAVLADVARAARIVESGLASLSW
jgi:AcrR family transcriptional regulator